MFLTLLVLVLFICLAGIVYPFPPFKTRKKAIGFAFWAFIAYFISFIIENNNPKVIAKRAEAANTAIAKAELAIEANDLEQAKSILDALNDDAANQEKEAVSVIESKIEAKEIIAEIQAILLNEDLPSVGRLHLLHDVWDEIRNEHTKTALADPFEADILAIVLPVPANDLETNRLGYALLTDVDAFSTKDNPNYSKKERIYNDKIAAAEKTETLTSIRNATRGLNKRYDKIDGITWYTHPNSPKYINSRTTTYLYLGVPDEGDAFLRLKTTYSSDAWLFVRSVEAFVDGETYTLTSSGFDQDSDIKIWEWKDEKPTVAQISTLTKMAEGREVILRFKGTQYRKDKTLSKADKSALKAILKTYGDIPK